MKEKVKKDILSAKIMSLGYKEKLKLSKKCDIQVNVSKIDLVYLINPLIDNNEVMKMDNLKKRRKRLVIFLIIVILSFISIIIFGTLCQDDVCALSISLNRRELFSEHHTSHRHDSNITQSLKNKNSHLSYDDVLNDDFQNKFDINSNDVMVIL